MAILQQASFNFRMKAYHNPRVGAKLAKAECLVWGQKMRAQLWAVWGPETIRNGQGTEKDAISVSSKGG